MTSLNRRQILALSAGAAFALTPTIALAKKPTYTSWGKAIRGYDPVAYFTQGKPVKGSKNHTHEWNGATWYFASAENKAAFASNPSAYAPQYGGYCAYAVSQGYTASTVPEAWDIVNGKLYLNYSKSVQRTWKKKQSSYIQSADRNWPGVLN